MMAVLYAHGIPLEVCRGSLVGSLLRNCGINNEGCQLKLKCVLKNSFDIEESEK